MKIAINCWVLRNKQLDGIGYFTVNTISKIIQNHPNVSFVLFCDKKYNENYFDYPNVEIKKIFPPYRHPILYLFYLEIVLPFFLRKINPNILVSVDGFLSLTTNCRQLSIIHDLNFEHFPDSISLKNRLYFRFFFKYFARKANRVATVSHFSKRDIMKTYNISEAKIDVIFSGINSGYHPISQEKKIFARTKFSAGHPYFFFVGSVHPRKNIERLMFAFSEFKRKTNSDIKLVIAGAMLWSNSTLRNSYKLNDYKNDIIFTGRLSDDDLRLAIGGAYALTFVPIFEGFGLPIVEAFAAEIPVITSKVTSLPEVAGDAAIYVDPFDTDSIFKGLELLYNNYDNIYYDLVAKGKDQVKKFSWDKTASLLWESILKATT